MLTIEPWHPGEGFRQDDFTLAATIAGKWDARYLKMAAAVRAYRRPVMIRYAHEMNGTWYPWGLVSPNAPSQYVQAWRHVVTLFRRSGATNALWVWAPNIRRSAAQRNVGAWWPGGGYVDLVGVRRLWHARNVS
jgi:beta-mannanase